MNAHRPSGTPSYVYDCTHASFHGSNAPIFGYDWSAECLSAMFPETSLGSTAGSRQFTGKERDAESGLDYFGARYYGSALGRFTSADPLLNSGQPWDPQTWNRYSYTLNNPLRYTDPLGLWTWGKCSGNESECAADRDRFRTSVKNATEALKGLDPKSNEAKALKATLDKIGDDPDSVKNPKGSARVNFGYAGETDGRPNLGLTFGKDITINYEATDNFEKNMTASEASALDAGLTAHEGTHVIGPGLFGVLKGHFEHPAYYVESVTYQGLHNTDRGFGLWNESWRTRQRLAQTGSPGRLCGSTRRKRAGRAGLPPLVPHLPRRQS
jgi:RHS repeat-associated protein